MIELIVVIALIAILVGLTLAAVQNIRAAAGRLQCAHQIRQQALALHNYHDTESHFPSGVVNVGPAGQIHTGWQTYILPYLERGALWERARDAFRQAPSFSYPPSPIANVVKFYGCPLDERTASTQMYRTTEIGMTSYLGVSGENLLEPAGIFFADSRVRLTDVHDGTSSTLLIGERPPAPNYEFGWWYGGLGQNKTGSLDTVLGTAELNRSRNGRTKPQCPPGPYSFVPGSRNSICDIFHFWSLHSGGANFAFADGSVRFLRYAANDVMPALGTRAGGESVVVPE